MKYLCALGAILAVVGLLMTLALLPLDVLFGIGLAVFVALMVMAFAAYFVAGRQFGRDRGGE